MDAALGERFDQVGGGEHPAGGHDLPQVPLVVEFAVHLTTPSQAGSAARTPESAPCAGRKASSALASLVSYQLCCEASGGFGVCTLL